MKIIHNICIEATAVWRIQFQWFKLSLMYKICIFLQHLWKLTSWTQKWLFSCLCDFRCGSSAPCSPLWTRGASRTSRPCPSIWRCVPTLRESPGRRRFTCRVSKKTSKPNPAAKLRLWLTCSSRRGSWCKALIGYYKAVTLLHVVTFSLSSLLF